MKTLKDIQILIGSIGENIDLPKGMALFIQDKPLDDATPYLEIKSNEYHYVIRERGIEYSRNITSDLNELLYWFFENVVSELSFEYEFNNRIKGEDSRRQAFTKKTALLNQLDSSWKDRWLLEMEIILEKNPYNDNL